MKQLMKHKITIAIFALVVGMIGAIVTNFGSKEMTKPQTASDFAKVTVTIVAGVQVILESSNNKSFVLTNKHVCQLIQVGGIVETQAHDDFNVESYQLYPKHDLCLIRVNTNLKVNTQLAPSEPRAFTEVSAAGHPDLLPLIVSSGHLSDRMSVEIMVDVSECVTDDDFQRYGMLCVFMGKPILRTFDAMASSLTIMPGSSGSGVFNSEGLLVGLVFAGPGDGIGYGFTVPHKYLVDFLSNLKSFKVQRPDSKRKPRNFLVYLKQIQDGCRDNIYCEDFLLPGIK
jgi:S1-C subfamily serine protease